MMAQNHSVLIIEDNLPLARTYEGYLSKYLYEVLTVPTASHALSELNERTFDVILLDIMLPDASGIDILKTIVKSGAHSSVIMITSGGSVGQAVEAMHLGAHDYLLKPFSADRLRITIRNGLEKLDLKKTVERYKKEFDRPSYCDFIGSSLSMQAIYRIVDSAAPSNATVFIKGETGTGKELMARAIHKMSARGKQNFIALNCAAIPQELMESEIFGHVKGAFTGAIERRDGAAFQADEGTLFFDEICEMDFSLQAKLLRFVQTGTYQKVGSDKLERADIRFVCATNRDPVEEVEQGRFREDLFYRLHIIPATLPPLREREGDIVELANHFLNFYAKEEDKDFENFDAAVVKRFNTYEWPGNVRELQNAIHRIVVLNNGNTVTSEMLPGSLKKTGIRAIIKPSINFRYTISAGDKTVLPMRQVELAHIQATLKITGNNVPKAAALLEVSPSTIYRRLKDLL